MSGASKTYTDAEARRILQKEGITVNSPKPKTSLDGIQVNSINGLIGFKKDCKCDIVVTGGTEPGHAKGEKSHGTGHKIDIRPNQCIDAFISGTGENIGKRRDGTPLYQLNSAVFAYEKNHWDILFP